MSNQDGPQQPDPRIDLLINPGAYATGLAVIHSQEEFMLDFINGIAAPPIVAARIVVTSLQLKRILRVLWENIRLYEEAFGAIPAMSAKASSKNTNAGDLYAQLYVPDELLGGRYSNTMTSRYTRDVFILDFMTKFPPHAKIVARLLISTQQIRSISGAIEDNIAQYEKRYSKIEEAKSTDQPPGFSLN
ncbi:MAG: DUF3467 domain-containing protein [Nitrospirota bacterium]|nr:DUF3467 domain-containing protein [Nitrospirota bacterium]